MSELPRGWCSARLDELTARDSTIVYGIIQPGPEVAGGVPYVRPTELVNGGIALDALKHTSSAIAQQYDRSSLKTGDIILAIVGTIGKLAVVPAELEGGNITQSSARIRPGPALVPGFLQLALASPQLRVQFDSAEFGLAVRRLNVAHVRALEIPVPPLAEQHRIVTKLDDLIARSRRAKAALDAIPPLLDKLRQSVLAAAFRGDLTADWREKNPDVEPAEKLLARIRVERRKKWEEAELAKMKAKGKAPGDDRWKAKYVEPEPVDESELPELPEGWCWASARDLIISIEAGASFKCDERPPSADEVGVLKVSAVTWGEYDEEESKTCTDRARIDPSLFVRDGDFLFSRANTIDLVGACVIARNVTRSIMLSDKILRFNIVSGAAGWLLHALRSPLGRRQIEALSSGNQLSMRNIGQERVLEICIPVPPAAEQAEILRRVEAAHISTARFTAAREDGRDRLTHLDQAILAKAFRGELVPQDPNDEPADVMLARLRAGVEAPAAPKGRKARR